MACDSFALTRHHPIADVAVVVTSHVSSWLRRCWKRSRALGPGWYRLAHCAGVCKAVDRCLKFDRNRTGPGIDSLDIYRCCAGLADLLRCISTDHAKVEVDD